MERREKKNSCFLWKVLKKRDMHFIQPAAFVFSVHHGGCADVSQHGEADKRKACTDSLRARRGT